MKIDFAWNYFHLWIIFAALKRQQVYGLAENSPPFIFRGHILRFFDVILFFLYLFQDPLSCLSVSHWSRWTFWGAVLPFRLFRVFASHKCQFYSFSVCFWSLWLFWVSYCRVYIFILPAIILCGCIVSPSGCLCFKIILHLNVVGFMLFPRLFSASFYFVLCYLVPLFLFQTYLVRLPLWLPFCYYRAIFSIYTLYSGDNCFVLFVFGHFVVINVNSLK